MQVNVWRIRDTLFVDVIGIMQRVQIYKSFSLQIIVLTRRIYYDFGGFIELIRFTNSISFTYKNKKDTSVC